MMTETFGCSVFRLSGFPVKWSTDELEDWLTNLIINCQKSCRVTGSTPVVGSSSSSTRGRLTRAEARPRVLLLDEPTTGVDPLTRQDFWQLIIHLVSNPPDEDGVCVFISTPYMDEAARCHRLGFMRHGKIVAEGSAGQLRLTLNERILELRGAPLPLLLRIASQDPGVEDVRLFGDRLHLRLKESQLQATIDRLKITIPQGGGQYSDAHPVLPVLEDVFIALANSED